MSKKTRLMSKLFSESTPAEYKEIIAEKVDEALTNGKAEYSADGKDLTFQKVDEDVLVADHSNGEDQVEVTKVSTNPENENDLVMEPVDVEVHNTETPDGGKTTVSTTAASESEDPIKLCPETHMFYIEGKEDKYPTYEEAKKALDASKATKTESEDQNLKSVQINVLPGEGVEPDADIVEDLLIEPDMDVVGTQRYSLRFKNFSEKKAKMIAKLFAASTEAIENMIDCDVDEDVQVKFEGDKMKVMSVTIGKPARTFSEPTEAPTEEPTAAPTEAPTETPTEAPTEAPTEEPTEKPATKTESEPTDPKVTLTIENLEPASVGDLLKAGMDEPKEDVAPVVSPNNANFKPKQFSVTPKQASSINPLLTTDIN